MDHLKQRKLQTLGLLFTSPSSRISECLHSGPQAQFSRTRGAVSSGDKRKHPSDVEVLFFQIA